MKTLLLSSLLFFSFAASAQSIVTHYMQLSAGIDFGGGGVVDKLREPKHAGDFVDTVINIKAINAIIEKYKTPAGVLTELSKYGWTLVTTNSLAWQNGPALNSAEMIYYLKKELKE